MLPQKLPLPLMQTQWAEQLDPIISNELIQGQLLKGVVLKSGSINQVNHKLGRKLIGWFPVGQNANAVMWDSQVTNQNPQLILLLSTSADVICNLWVF